MRPLLYSSQMRKCDEITTDRLGMPQAVLMERAALAVAEEIKASVKTEGKKAKVLAVAGPGNNGADAAAAGRLLSCSGMEAVIFVCGDADRYTSALKMQLDIAGNFGCKVVYDDMSRKKTMTEQTDGDFDAVIDGLLGIGLSRPLSRRFAGITAEMNAMHGYKVAVDMPTGVSADDGSVYENAFRADTTVTFAYEKPGQYFYPGTSFCGRIVCADIGINSYSFMDTEPELYLLEGSRDFGEIKRDPSGNKGSFGKLLIAAGHKDVCGAAILACRSAYRAGCGMVRLFTTESNRIIVQETVPEAVLCTYPDECTDEDTDLFDERLGEYIKWADRIMAGPGLGTDAQSVKIVRYLAAVEDVPVVFDADALNIIAEHKDIRGIISENKNRHIVLTPHMGELSRLLGGMSVQEIKKDWLSNVHRLADELGVTVVSKDARTLIVSPQRKKAYINVLGNSGMATAGAGDVLAGIAGALISADRSADEAAARSVVIHARAGDLAAAGMGEKSIMAGDLIAYIGR